MRSNWMLVVFVSSILVASNASAQAGKAAPPSASSKGATDASPIFGVRIPPDYRRWQMVAVSQEIGFDELRGILGNEIAMKAYREGTLPFPDGAMLAKIAWKRLPSAEFNGAVVPGAATTVQIMVKDAKKYATTGGWGFGRFIAGKPVDELQHRTCFECHQANVKDHDFVFTRFAP